jgi:AraC family transcriptional regulator
MRLRRVLNNNNVIEYTKVSVQRQRLSAEDFNIRMVFNERQDLLFGKRRVSIFPDCLAIIPPGSSFECIIDAEFPVQALSIVLDAGFIGSFLRARYPSITGAMPKTPPSDFLQTSLVPMSSDMRRNFQHLLNKIVHCRAEDALINEYICRFLVDYINVERGLSKSRRQRLSFAKAATQDDISRRLVMAKEFISNNYNCKFHLSDLAAASLLSENHLLRTPYQYLGLIRLSRAKTYLEQNQYPVNEIVMLVGLESVSSFIKLFKATFGITPLQYRKRYKAPSGLTG